MKVFISWSGERSKVVADTLRVWLKDVIQALYPWISGSDIEKGTWGGLEIAKELYESRVGIFCVTRENLPSPWMLEAEVISIQTRLIKTGGRLVRHARRLVFHLAEVLVTREMLTGILEGISRLRLAPG